jgi:hypothetical protein
MALSPPERDTKEVLAGALIKAALILRRLSNAAEGFYFRFSLLLNLSDLFSAPLSRVSRVDASVAVERLIFSRVRWTVFSEFATTSSTDFWGTQAF